jgi:hypothetical protein
MQDTRKHLPCFRNSLPTEHLLVRFYAVMNLFTQDVSFQQGRRDHGARGWHLNADVALNF